MGSLHAAKIAVQYVHKDGLGDRYLIVALLFVMLFERLWAVATSCSIFILCAIVDKEVKSEGEYKIHNTKWACVNYFLRNGCKQLPWETRRHCQWPKTKEQMPPCQNNLGQLIALFSHQVMEPNCCHAPPYLPSIFMGTRNDPRIASASFR